MPYGTCGFCKFYRVLNPNYIIDGELVKSCANGEQPGRFCGFEEAKDATD